MAISVALDTTVLPNPLDKTQQFQQVHVILTFSGSFASNGDTVPLSNVGMASDQIPIAWRFFEATPAANAPAYGAVFVYLPGTNQNNGLLEIFQGATQVTASTATYASLDLPTNFTLKAVFEFPLFI
jgi:hypothetical protein